MGNERMTETTDPLRAMIATATTVEVVKVVKARHTPGPWTFSYDDDTGRAEVFVRDNLPGRALIAEMDSQPEAEANARVIAAVPELLEAARSALFGFNALVRAGEEALRRGCTKMSTEDLVMAAAQFKPVLERAIAKAEGR